jgi:hypothetical protein
MFPKIFLFLSILPFLTDIACKPSAEFPIEFKGEQIYFGQGGGFSGILTYYALLDDGRLFQKGLRDSSYILVDTWKGDFVTQMFTNYHQLHLDTINYYEPGDLYYFLQYKSANKPLKRIAWGRSGFKPDDNLVTYYNLLFKSTKSKS